MEVGWGCRLQVFERMALTPPPPAPPHKGEGSGEPPQNGEFGK
jgi:hypothetical protein